MNKNAPTTSLIINANDQIEWPAGEAFKTTEGIALPVKMLPSDVIFGVAEIVWSLDSTMSVSWGSSKALPAWKAASLLAFFSESRVSCKQH